MNNTLALFEQVADTLSMLLLKLQDGLRGLSSFSGTSD